MTSSSLANDTSPHYRVTIHLTGGTAVELTSTTEPRRLTNGEIEATWLDDPRRGTVGHINWSNVAIVMWRQANRGSGSVA